jgi:hypothetical protein
MKKPPEVDDLIVSMLKQRRPQEHIRAELKVSVSRIKRVAAYHGLTATIGRAGRRPKNYEAYALCRDMLRQGYPVYRVAEATGLSQDLVVQQKARFCSPARLQVERARIKDDLFIQVSRLRAGGRWAKLYRKAIDDLQALDPLEEGEPLHLVQDSVLPTKEDILRACLDGRYERARALLHSFMLIRFPSHVLHDPRLPKPTGAPVDETSSTDPKS